jgi:hypothetical protein
VNYWGGGDLDMGWMKVMMRVSIMGMLYNVDRFIIHFVIINQQNIEINTNQKLEN